MCGRRRQLIDEVSKSIPSKELYNRSGYYVADNIVIKARGFKPSEVTFRDIVDCISPENRVIIQKGRHLECHFPLYEHDVIRNILESVKGFTYTLYSCETALESAKKTVANNLPNKGIPSIALAYDSYYYILDGKIVKTYKNQYKDATCDEIMSIRKPGELTVIQEDKHLKIFISKSAVSKYKTRLDKVEKLGFTYELVLE